MYEQTIWVGLKRFGLTDAGAAGVMGNMYAESRLFPMMLQDDDSGGYRRSVEFTRAADRGEKNESMQTGGGYGLCQWGGNRKYGLLIFAQSKGVSVGDVNTQLEYLWKELHSGEYPILLNTLLTTTDVKKAASDFCTVFERPSLADVENRTGHAYNYYCKYASASDK